MFDNDSVFKALKREVLILCLDPDSSHRLNCMNRRSLFSIVIYKEIDGGKLGVSFGCCYKLSQGPRTVLMKDCP